MDFGTFLYLIIYKKIETAEPLTCFKLQILFLKCLGTWLPDTENKIILKLYSIYAFLTRLLFIYLFIFTEIMFIGDAKDVQTISDATFILTTELAMGFKVINFNKKYKRIRRIFKKIDNELFCVKDLKEAKLLEISMKRTLMIFILFLFPASMTLTGLAIVPFFDNNEFHLPLPAWFPFDVQHSSSVIFSTIYVYQIVGLVYCAFFDIASDTFIMGLISIMDAHIKILGHRFEQIGFLEKKYENQPVIPESLMKKNNIGLDANAITDNYFYNKVIKCIMNHEEILRYIREFELIFREAIFAQLVSSVIIVCMTALQLINTIPGSMKFFTMLLYLISMLWQIFIYCWMGNEVTYSSAKLSEKAYFCNFHVFDKRTKNALILFMQRSTRKITIMAGGLFQILLSLENFMGIIKASYTYLAVLRNVQSGKKLH